MANTAAPTVYSRLLDLPGEIKNRIYRDTVVQKRSIRISICTQLDENFDVAGYCIDPTGPALGRVCHELRNEVNPIYYEENVFTFDNHSVDPSALTTFRRMAGVSAKRIVKLEIRDTVNQLCFAPVRSFNFKSLAIKASPGVLEVQTECLGFDDLAKMEWPIVCCCRMKRQAEQSMAIDRVHDSRVLTFLRCYASRRPTQTSEMIELCSLEGCEECVKPHVTL